MEREVCLTVNTNLKVNTPVPKASTKNKTKKKAEKVSRTRVSFPPKSKTPSQQTTCRRTALVATSKFHFQKAGKSAKKKTRDRERERKKKVHTKAENRHSAKLATSTPLVLSLWPNLLTAANPELTLHRNERWIRAEWAYGAIVLTGLFWGNFLAYCMKKRTY